MSFFSASVLTFILYKGQFTYLNEAIIIQDWGKKL